MGGIYDESGGVVGEAYPRLQQERQDMTNDGGMKDRENEWHLDKKVLLGIILALFMQAIWCLFT